MARHPGATCQIAGCCQLVNSLSRSQATCHDAGCKISIRHTENSFSPYLIFFLNAVWALTSGGFRIVSDTLVSGQSYDQGQNANVCNSVSETKLCPHNHNPKAYPKPNPNINPGVLSGGGHCPDTRAIIQYSIQLCSSHIAAGKSFWAVRTQSTIAVRNTYHLSGRKLMSAT